jgi:hypothetical protein
MQKPYGGKATIKETQNTLEIRIPSAKNWMALIFLPIWLCGWGFGLVSVLKATFSGQIVVAEPGSNFPPALFVLIWLTLWTAGGLFAGYIWWRMAFGAETLKIGATSISMGRSMSWFERERSFDAQHIWRLRTVPIPAFSIFENRANLWWGSPSLAFDYGSRTVRFGAGIDEAEAYQILELVQKKFPEYAPRKSTAWENLGGYHP